MKNTKEFPFSKARRITGHEVKMAQEAIEKITGKKREFRGRPPKLDIEKYKPISIRLHPKVILWAKGQARKRDIGYQTVINEILLKKVW